MRRCISIIISILFVSFSCFSQSKKDWCNDSLPEGNYGDFSNNDTMFFKHYPTIIYDSAVPRLRAGEYLIYNKKTGYWESRKYKKAKKK